MAELTEPSRLDRGQSWPFAASGGEQDARQETGITWKRAEDEPALTGEVVRSSPFYVGKAQIPWGEREETLRHCLAVIPRQPQQRGAGVAGKRHATLAATEQTREKTHGTWDDDLFCRQRFVGVGGQTRLGRASGNSADARAAL